MSGAVSHKRGRSGRRELSFKPPHAQGAELASMSFIRVALARATACASASALAVSGLALFAAPPASAATSTSLTGVRANGQSACTQNLVITAAVDGGAAGKSRGTCRSGLLDRGRSGPRSARRRSPAASADVRSPPMATLRDRRVFITARWRAARRTRCAQPSPRFDDDPHHGGERDHARAAHPGDRVRNGQQRRLASPQGSIQFPIVGGGDIGGRSRWTVPSRPRPDPVDLPPCWVARALIATYIPSSTNCTCGASCVAHPTRPRSPLRA